MLSRVVVKVVRRDDHVDGCGLGLLSRRRARRRGGAALLGPALRVFLHILELATLLEAFLSYWRHCDSCIYRRESGNLVVTPTETPITHLVMWSLRFELVATRRAGLSNKILDHVDCWSEVANMLAG